jgi:signal peptidase II
MMLQSKPARLAGVFALIVALLLDQLSKAAVMANASVLSEGVPVFPGFNLIFLHNNGVTFGLFSHAPWWALTLVALVISSWVASMMWRATQGTEAFGWGLILGGALGNIIDRVRFGAVTDFLDVYLGPYHWPAFNLADVAVVTGVTLMVLLPVISRQPRIS